MISLLSLHVGTLIVTACLILYSDYQAFLYFTGKKQLLDRKVTNVIHYLVWTGLLVMIGTGIGMALPAYGYYISSPGFLMKMIFVGILIGNSFVISSLKDIAFSTPFRDLTRVQKIKLFISGVLSGAGWIGAAITALIVLG